MSGMGICLGETTEATDLLTFISQLGFSLRYTPIAMRPKELRSGLGMRRDFRILCGLHYGSFGWLGG